MRILPILAATAGLVALHACMPVVGCGCSQPLREVTGSGRVTLPGGGAAAGAVVHGSLAIPATTACGPTYPVTATADAGGAYSLLLLHTDREATLCLRAEPPAGSPLRASEVVRAPWPAGDTVRIDLALRPAP